MDDLHTMLRARRISQRELARRLGISDASVSLWVNGKRNISQANAIAIEAVTGIPRKKLRPDLFEDRESAA